MIISVVVLQLKVDGGIETGYKTGKGRSGESNLNQMAHHATIQLEEKNIEKTRRDI